MGGNTPYGVNDLGLRLAVRLTPRARRAGIRGIERGADGGAYVKAGVTAPAEGGKANRALIKLLARELRLPASSMRLVGGAKERRKSVQIAGDPTALKKRLELFLRRIAVNECGEIT